MRICSKICMFYECFFSICSQICMFYDCADRFPFERDANWVQHKKNNFSLISTQKIPICYSYPKHSYMLFLPKTLLHAIPALYQVRICRHSPPLRSGHIYMKDAHSAESIEKSYFQFLVFELWWIAFTIDGDNQVCT